MKILLDMIRPKWYNIGIGFDTKRFLTFCHALRSREKGTLSLFEFIYYQSLSTKRIL